MPGREKNFFLVDASSNHASGLDAIPEDAIISDSLLSLGPCSLSDHERKIAPSSINKISGRRPGVEIEDFNHNCHLPP